VDRMVRAFDPDSFTVVLFHYDGEVGQAVQAVESIQLTRKPESTWFGDLTLEPIVQ
jgi:hypothetical protein